MKPTKQHNSSQDDAVFQKLVKWLEILEQQATEIHEWRFVFERVAQIVQPHSEFRGNVFLEHLNIWYASSISVGVRRLVDPHPDGISYVRFLELIKRNPCAVTRSRIIRAWDGHELATKKFDEFSKPEQEYLDMDIVENDLMELKAETSSIKNYVDKFVAHNDSQPLRKLIPSFDDLKVALNRIETTNNKYASLFSGYSGELTPSIICPWENIFRKPWIV